MKSNKESGNKVIKAIKNKIEDIILGILIIFSVVIVTLTIIDTYKNPVEKQNIPRVRIDYINSDGSTKYSRYSNHVNYGHGSVRYIDFYTGAIVNTTETVNVIVLK